MSVTNANSNNSSHTNISASIHRNMNFSGRQKDFISGGSSNVCISEGYSSDIGSISIKESAGTKKERKGSLVKGIIENEEAFCISLDLEHGEDKCGLTQLYAVLFRLGVFETSDIQKDLVMREVINEYFRPSNNAAWNPRCREATGLHAEHPFILNADPIHVVW